VTETSARYPRLHAPVETGTAPFAKAKPGFIRRGEALFPAPAGNMLLYTV